MSPPKGRPPFRRGPVPGPQRHSRPEEGGLGGTQVEGRHAVRELLAVGRRRAIEILMQRGLDPAEVLDEIDELAAEARVPVRLLGPEELASRARSQVHQGVVARAEPVESTTLDDLADREHGRPFLIVLDGVTDPHNLGAVLRSALGAGATGVVLPRHRSVHLTPTVAKAAAGAIEHLHFALAPGVPNALERLGRDGVWSVGLEADGPTDLDAVTVFTEPVALVLGAEGEGLSALTRARCDVVARIDLVGPLESLNVSAAAAVACFAVSRARRSH